MSAENDAVSWLRSALKHLYDPAVLRKSPLIPMLGLAEAKDPASELRQTLTRAIRSLQPEASIPADAQVWRVYEILLYRYVQRLSQLELADQLGMSIRHLARLESQALQVLDERLRQDLCPPASDSTVHVEPPSQTSPFHDELAWLAETGVGEAVDLQPTLSSVLDLIQPMARQHSVTLNLSLCPDLMPLAIHPVALRQILLSLLGATIRQAPGQRVLVAARALEWQVEVQVRTTRTAETARNLKDDEDIAASLEMASRLIDACGGGLVLRTDARVFVAIATLPAIEQTPLLVIDDNANTLRLLQRYVTNTRYRVMPATTLQEGLTLAAETRPRVIVLDVMMPDIDGWEVLGRLRQHPLTAHVPIVVCTILAEEELALSLGASSYVRKPVSREAFLEALDRVDPAAPAAR